MKTSLLRASAFMLLTILMLGTACAENMKKIGNLDVHYIALNSTFLTPEIASNYGITRSKVNALINISVLDNSQAGQTCFICRNEWLCAKHFRSAPAA